MKFDPRTEARYEEESDLLVIVDNEETGRQIRKYLYEQWPDFSYSQKSGTNISGYEISVLPSPDQMTYNQMQGYAMAVAKIFGAIVK